MIHMDGNFICENNRCERALEVDHVTLVTTAHVRRFCTVDCLTESHTNYYSDLGLSAEALKERIARDKRAKSEQADDEGSPEETHCHACGQELGVDTILEDLLEELSHRYNRAKAHLGPVRCANRFYLFERALSAREAALVISYFDSISMFSALMESQKSPEPASQAPCIAPKLRPMDARGIV